MYSFKNEINRPIIKRIKDYPNYFVDTQGKVYSKGKNGFILNELKGGKHNRKDNRKNKNEKTKKDRDKIIRTVTLTDLNGKQKTMKVHRLVALAFKPNVDGKETINHEDGNALNNNVSNLSWMTIQENIKHSIEHGFRHKKHGQRLKEKQSA